MVPKLDNFQGCAPVDDVQRQGRHTWLGGAGVAGGPKSCGVDVEVVHVGD